ncbi:MAG: ABC transporter permease [Prevotellaceae bacterium]|jgi:hypothetical protein|nr:ABC transporter permease [Prevotellaceae bacterium]
MIKQILKMLWKQRRNHFGIFVEQLLVAAVLMLAVVSVAEMVKKYKTPGRLNTDNTFLMCGVYSGGDVSEEEQATLRGNMKVIAGNLKKLPCVDAIAATDNLMPYMDGDHHYLRMSDSIYVDDKRFLAITKVSDELGITVLKPEMEEGAWLENRALPDGSAPTVITRQLADKAGWTNATGKKITVKGQNYTVVGVATGLKQEPFSPSPVAMVIPEYIGLSNNNRVVEYLVRIKADREQEFVDAFFKEFQRLISDERAMPMLIDSKATKGMLISGSTIGVALQAIPTVFLLIFAFLGTFGLSWMLSRKRLKEFALRMALGSTKSRLMAIVIGESLLITVIAIIPALLLSFFIYEYAAVHVIGVGATVGIMLLFSAVSAWYPAWKVSRVNPAEALQYE